MIGAINITKMHHYQRSDFLDHVIWHLKGNNFYTFEDSDKRVFESKRFSSNLEVRSRA